MKRGGSSGEERGMRTFVSLLLAAFLLLCWPAPTASADGLVLTPPVDGAVGRGFDDVGRFEAGHRGVDLRGSPGETVRSAAVGVVRFAGRVAGVPTVSIDHGNGWRTTYQPVLASVAEGDRVEAGQPLGTLAAGHCPAGCLHWGLTDGTRYADPLGFLASPPIRLVPRGTSPAPPPRIAEATLPAARVAGLPVAGRLSSPFGMRRHPITGVWKLHDGTDIVAPCGTPVLAPAAGTVTRAYYNPAYGWRVFLDHGGGLVTAYNHLPSLSVAVGQRIEAGGSLGAVGTTGLSTGCHLHWMAWRGGRLIDPLSLGG